MLEKLKYGTFVYNNIIDNSNNLYWYVNDNTTNRTAIVVVGCGGTGGRLIPQLAQHINNHNNALNEINHKQWIKHKISLVLIDDDTVN